MNASVPLSDKCAQLVLLAGVLFLAMQNKTLANIQLWRYESLNFAPQSASLIYVLALSERLRMFLIKLLCHFLPATMLF